MDTIRNCPGCQKPLEANAPDGLCPKCLIKAGLGTGVDIGPDSQSQAEGGKLPFVAPTPEELAKPFPQLEILSFIGQGGMGAVYKARQKALDRTVALKILPPGIGKDPAFAERFTREAKALAKLNHPGIVTLYEFGQADGLFFFLMEFVDGMNLRHLLEVERISPREALAIVPQICDALQYAHDQGIVHRDIKPENILLDRRGRVKVADFGLAKLVGTEGEPSAAGGMAVGSAVLTEAGKLMGTPQYMAPEQREHPTEVDHRADIYSLGVVFYQMLTGELPGKPIEAPSSKVQIDVRLDEVVLHALEKAPERRYQHVSEVKTAVETIATSAAPGRSPNQAEVPQPFPKWLLFRIGLPKWLARPPATRGRLRAALIVGVLVWLFVTGTVTLITWIRAESWKVVAVINCPHDSRGRPMSEHFKFTATMIELIRSDVILGRVIDRLQLDERSGKLDERWGKRNLGLNLTKAQAMVLLKRRLDVRSAGGTLIQVGVFGKRPEEPEEAMDIANTIAEELRAFRIEQHDSPADMLEMTLRFTPPYILLGLAAGLVLGLLAGGLVLWRGFLRRGSPATAVPPPGNPSRPRAVWRWVAATVGMVLLIPVVVIFVTALARESHKAEVVRRELQDAERVRSTAEQAGLAGAGGLKVHFGRVIETLIATADADDQGWGFFDLETDKPFKPPFPLTFQPNQGPAFVELTPELKEWIKARSVDLLLHLGETNWDMMTLGMQEEFAGQLSEWETISPEMVVGLFAKKDADHLVRDEVPASSFGHSYRGEYGAVTAFRTHRNAMGVYQIQGMGNINRRGVGIRYKLVLETLELPAARLGELQLKENGGSLPTAEAETKHKLTQAKMEYLRYLALGVVVFAEKNNGSLPKDLRESFSYPGTDAPPGFLPDLFELVCQGRISDIKNPAQTIIIREKDPVRTWDGQWMKCYGFADTHVEVHVDPSGQFETWEQPRLKRDSKTFSLRHRLASEMANDLGQILLGRVGMEARPAPDNMQLTVTAPSDVLNRVSTFVAVTDWPKRIAPGKDYYYPREDVEQAGRSFFYACSIEDIEGVTRMLAPGVLAELKGTNLTAHGVLGEEKDAGLVRQLRGNWEGKEAAVRRVVQAWNRFPLRRLQVEPKISISFELRYFASAAFEGAPEDWVELSFIPERRLTNTKNDTGPEGPLLIDTLPPWFEQKEPGLKALKPPHEKLPAAASEGEQGIGQKLMP